MTVAEIFRPHLLSTRYPGGHSIPYSMDKKQLVESFRRLADELERDDTLIAVHGASLNREWAVEAFCSSALTLKFIESITVPAAESDAK